MMTQFKQNSARIQNVLEIMKDREERNWRDIVAEMDERYGMHVARATLYYYFNMLVAKGRMHVTKRKIGSGPGRSKTFFKLA
jgi:hypothetical protein